MDWGTAVAGVALATHELTLLAAVGLFAGGIDDLAVDVLYAWRRLRRGAERRTMLQALPPPRRRYAIFVAAWDEAAVIGAMLRTAVAQLGHDRLTIFVGTYPNDPATVRAVAEVARSDARVRLVIGDHPGPTTKADCLNTLWRAMCTEERDTGRHHDVVMLHDAEDVVHRGELHAVDAALDDASAVQLPVAPLPRPGAHLVGGTYLDEFSEAHHKNLVVRQQLGAGLPLAGVGCAVARAMLDRIAAARGGLPFDATSLTEDYELGLTVAGLGGRTVIALVFDADDGEPVAVRALFPSTLDAAVRQKTRWLIGIALAGWDRMGWRGSHGVGDAWMRMRDRRAPAAMLVVLAAYVALVGWAVGAVAMLAGAPPPQAPSGWLAWIIVLNGLMLLWRLGVRCVFVARLYGWDEGLRSMPRMFVGNIVAMMAARRAIVRYMAMLRGAPLRWDKTAHQFPDAPR